MFSILNTKNVDALYESIKKSPPYIQLKNTIKGFCKRNNLPFRNYVYAYMALMHKSYLQKNLYNNERLEFLGDAVLNILITEYLYLSYANSTESFLSKLRSYVVSQSYLIRVAIRWHVGEYILSIYSMENESQKLQRIIANVVEALIGGLYLDRGYVACKKIFLPLFIPFIQEVVEGEHSKDYKSMLQVYTQKHFNTIPRYSCLAQEEKDTVLFFNICVSCNDGTKTFASKNAWDTNKKKAEQKAAKELCLDLGIAIEHEFTT